MITKRKILVNSIINQFINYRVEQILYGFLVFLCFVINSCSKSSVAQYAIHLPDSEFSFTIDTTIFKFELDSTKVYTGDPILFSFINKTEGARFDMYIGTKNPIPDWKYTFDFQESTKTLEEQVKMYTENGFIRKLEIPYWDCPGRLVQYSYDRRKKIESQFICFGNLRINVILSADKKQMMINFCRSLRQRSRPLICGINKLANTSYLGFIFIESHKQSSRKHTSMHFV